MSMAIVAVASAVVTVGAAYMQSENARSQAASNYELAKVNAEMADLDAAEAKRDGVSTEVRAIGEMDKMRDSRTAAISATGVEQAGTVKSLIAEDNLNAALNFYDLQQQTIAGELKYKREAANIRSQGAINKAAGEANADNIMLSGYAQAANIGANYYAGAGSKKPTKGK